MLAYFTSNGIPTEQVRGVDAHAMMASSGATSALAGQTKHLGYVSVVKRHISGSPVDGSVAWAHFDANDEVVAETVWWPELPASVVSEVVRLQAMIATPNSMDEFRAKLPTQVHDVRGEVWIHHSPPFAEAWSLSVTVDFLKPGWPSALSFDKSGARVIVHPQASNAGDQKMSVPGLVVPGALADAGGAGP